MIDRKFKSTGTVFGLTSIRQFRETIFNVALDIEQTYEDKKILVSLIEPKITSSRLKFEYEKLKCVFKDRIIDRIVIAVYCQGKPELISDFKYNLPDLSDQIQPIEKGQLKVPDGGAHFRLLKVFLLHALTHDTPVKIKWLSETAGCNYRITAAFLQGLGGLVEKTRDRKVRLKWISNEEIMQLYYMAKQYRITYRFRDLSGKGADYYHYINRLGKLNPPNLALGGVVGAQYHFPELDIVNTPRLDLSLFCPGKTVSLEFLKRLDPALELIESRDAPADVVINLVRHTLPMFELRDEGLAWADPVECLMDLYEARLEAQANQFFNFLNRNRD